MNFVGKIFIVLILVMSVAFLMVAVTIFQTHRNWQTVAMANKQKIQELQQSNEALQTEIQNAKDRLAREAAARRFALAALQSKSEQVESQLKNRETQYASLQAQAGQMATQIDAASKTLASALDQNSKLRTDLRDAQQTRDLSFAKVIELNEALNSSQGTLETLKEHQQQLLASNARMKLVLQRHDLTEFTSVADKPPTVEGTVTALGEKDLLEISIGSDDGLKKGHTLEVFRKNAYLGRVIVRETWPDRAVVQVIPEFRKGIIRKGDRVATKLG